MRIREETPLFEGGVSYCWNQYPTIEPLPRGFTPYRYRRTAPRVFSSGQTIGTVYCLSRRDFHSLLVHWNRADWHYQELLD